ncbi:MAG: PAS domain S-box protein [Planctomycetota bacterium]
MVELEAEGSVGIPLWSSTGEAAGILWVIYREPITEVGPVESTLTIFAHQLSAVLQRKEYDAAFKSLNSQFRAMFEQTGVGVVKVEVPTSRLLLANDAFCRILGISQSDVGKLTCMDLTHPAHLESGQRLHQQLVAGEIRDFTIEKRYVRPDGREVWANVTVSPMWKPGDPPTECISVIEDITERKAAEAALRESESLFRSLAKLAPIGVFLADSKGRCTWSNDQCDQLMGRPRDAIIGQGWINAVHVDDRVRVREAFARTVKTGVPFREEYRIARPDGLCIWVLDHMTRLKTDAPDDEERYLGTLVDLTEAKENEARRIELEQRFRQAQKMEAIGRLAGGVAHDFNNLLSVIVGHSELLLEDVHEDSEFRESLHEIRHAAERGENLTRQLLTFSRKRVIKPERIDVPETVERVEQMLRRLIGEDIALTTGSDANIPTIEASPGQLEQVLINLAVNARDAMPSGGRLLIETDLSRLPDPLQQLHPETSAQPLVHVCVSDSGIGMDSATKALIFEPFFTTKDGLNGTGLGLTTVYGIVKQAGGFVDVETSPGVGTTVHLYFPACSSPATPRKERRAAPDRTAARTNGETVLVVEDEEGVRRLTRNVLERGGFRVLTAADPLEARKLCENSGETIHVLLSDVVMPYMSGPELAEWFAVERPETRVLFMSGYTDDAITQRGLPEGVELLPKPFEPQRLLERVRELVESDS